MVCLLCFLKRLCTWTVDVPLNTVWPFTISFSCYCVWAFCNHKLGFIPWRFFVLSTSTWNFKPKFLSSSCAGPIHIKDVWVSSQGNWEKIDCVTIGLHYTEINMIFSKFLWPVFILTCFGWWNKVIQCLMKFLVICQQFRSYNCFRVWVSNLILSQYYL